MYFNDPIPNCVPEFYRSMREDAAGPAGSRVYEWYVIENINDPDERIDRVVPLDEAIRLYAASDCEDKRLGVTKDGTAAVDLAIRRNGREWLPEDWLKEDIFKSDPVIADACARIRRMLETVTITEEENPK